VLGVARETLVGASQTIATDPGGAVLGALALWVGAPVLAIIAFLTVVGFPIALAILIFALPSLWFLGYVVVGATIGGWIGQVLAPSVRGWPPWASVVSGMALLQTVALAPLVGPLLVLLAGHLGAGALLRRAWKQRALTTTPPSATQPDRDAATPDLHPPQGAAQPLRLPPTRGGPAFTRKA